jgi:hypothetical protein
VATAEADADLLRNRRGVRLLLDHRQQTVNQGNLGGEFYVDDPWSILSGILSPI